MGASKKCLVVSSHDLRRNTSSNIRTVALIQALAKKGYTVHCFFISANKEVDENLDLALKDSCARMIIYKEVQVQSSEAMVEQRKSNALCRIKGYIRTGLIKMFSVMSVYDIYRTQFYSLNKRDLDNLDNDYEMIISSSEPRSSHLLAKKICKICKLSMPWVQYWGDPMTNDVASEKLLRVLERREEHRLLRQAQMALYTNPIVVEYMQKKYPDCGEKINWIPTTDISSGEIKGESVQPAEYDVCYLGDYLTRYRDITPLYQACKKRNLKAAIVGNSDLQLDSAEGIRIEPRVSRKEAKQIEESSKIITILENKGINGPSIQIPGKLYHYALTDKPILVITESQEIKKYYAKYNRFVFAENNEQAIFEAISRILAGEDIGVQNMRLKDFSPEKIVDEFVTLIEKQEKILS